MKTSITIRSIAVLVLVLICNIMYSGNTTQDSLCLRLIGKITKTPENIGQTYTVEIIDNSTVIASKVVKPGKKFTFNVNRNGWYGLKIKNIDCVTKLISISTHVPEIEDGDVFLIRFELEEPISLAESKYLDADAIDFPLALISYEKGKDNFNYSEEYTKNIKTKLLSTFIGDKKEVVLKDASAFKNANP